MWRTSLLMLARNHLIFTILTRFNSSLITLLIFYKQPKYFLFFLTKYSYIMSNVYKSY